MSNFKDYYGDAVIKQCLGKIAEINKFSAIYEMSIVYLSSVLYVNYPAECQSKSESDIIFLFSTIFLLVLFLCCTFNCLSCTS